MITNHSFRSVAWVLALSFLSMTSSFANDGFPGTSQRGGIDQFLGDPALTAVTREFGPSIISMAQLPFRSKVAEAHHKPWSSWYFPKMENYGFQGPNSPLAKYDLVRRMKYYMGRKPAPRSAVEFENQTFNPRAQTWEGLCDAWSLAAITMPEPKRPVTIWVGNQGVTFSVGDLKYLMLRTFEGIEESQLKYYGQKFTGRADGWIFPDIFPNEFHRFLEVYLFQMNMAFIMDHDPGIEVWNVPVYKANYSMKAVPNDPNAVEVTTFVTSAEVVQSHMKDFVGTKEGIRTYHYILRGHPDGQGNLVVKSGEWIKSPMDGIDSFNSHPDFITAIADLTKMLNRKSYNPEIEVSLIDEILLNSY